MPFIYKVNIFLQIYLSFNTCIFYLNLVHSTYIPLMFFRGRQDGFAYGINQLISVFMDLPVKK